MKIIKNNHEMIYVCFWCKSEIELDKEDIKPGLISSAHTTPVDGFVCPCCDKFTQLIPKKSILY
jgi:hypothetical protein